MTTIAITGASGGLGRLTAERLLDRVDPADVVLLTRSPDRLEDLAARGATVRAADFDDPAGLEAALAGVERLLLISTDAVGSRLDHQKAAIAAAKAAGVRHVLYTSIVRADPANPAGVVPDHVGTEQALQESGLAYTVLRNALYSHMQAGTLQQAIASGQLVTNAGDGGTAYVTREDCAEVAAAILAEGGHEGEVLDVTGPAALTADDLAALARELGGGEVAVVHVDDDAYVAGLVEHAGLPEAFARLLASFGASTREGFGGEASTVVADVTGREPTPLRAAVEAERAGAR
jgi:NAD(P)H dehydrogenase (quinone)